MLNTRHGNTGREMVEGGAWAKVGRKHYRFIDGTEVVYDCNAWLWKIVGGASDGERYAALWPARWRVETTATVTAEGLVH